MLKRVRSNYSGLDRLVEAPLSPQPKRQAMSSDKLKSLIDTTDHDQALIKGLLRTLIVKPIPRPKDCSLEVLADTISQEVLKVYLRTPKRVFDLDLKAISQILCM